MSAVPIRLIIVLGAIVALGPLSIDMYLPAFPRMQQELQAELASVQLTLAVFFAGIAMGQLLYGPITDRFGRKRPLIAGLLGFVLASLGCASADSIESLILWRLVQAMTGCAGMVIARAIVRDRCEPQDMARLLSLLVLVMGLAPILAPSLGSMMLMHTGWQALFLFLAGFGLLCAVLVVVSVSESLPDERRTTSLTVVGSLHQYLHLLRHRKFLGYALAGGLAQAGMFAYISISSFVFIGGFGLSEQQFAVLFGVNAFGLILSSQLNRRLLQRLPAQQVLEWAMASYFFGAIVMSLNAFMNCGGLWGVALPLWFCLACLGFTFPNSTSAAMAPFGDRAGMASALLGTLQFGVAGLASFLVGHFGGEQALPMAVTMSVCATLAWSLLHWVRRYQPALQR